MFKTIDIMDHAALAMAVGVENVPAVMFWVNDAPADQPTSAMQVQSVADLAAVEEQVKKIISMYES